MSESEIHTLPRSGHDEKHLEDEGDIKTMEPVDVVERTISVEGDLQVTKEDYLDAEQRLSTMSVERCRAIMLSVRELHKHDQNFSTGALERMGEFLDNPDVLSNPHLHQKLITEMRLEALLVTENSPYAEVRAVVDNFDDPTMPSLTFRVWVIGILFSGLGAFINELFKIRNPSVYVTANVAQLLAYPFGRFLAASLPDKRFKMFGREHSLNPGRFNQKEHMLITIMATVAFNTPYTAYTVFVQALPVYFNQPYAFNFGYQLLGSLGTNFVGYGLAGLSRRFIVFPSYCVWPTSLVTIALNKAFHTDTNEAVPGPFGKMYSWSREKFFLIAFVAMFAYWWFPGFIFTALSYFNWINWIDPTNVTLGAICGSVNGLGVNPWPTFDFNNLTVQGWTPLVLPFFSIANQFFGMIIAFIMIVYWWFTNAYNTSYLPINSNKVFDNSGASYNVTKVLNAEGLFDNSKYQTYSQPWMAAGNLVIYFWFMAIYSCTISYVIVYHRHEVGAGFKALWRSIRRQRQNTEEEDLAEDVHWRLMKAYPEVPEWWYMVSLVIAAALGMVGVGAWPTNTSVSVVIYGIVMALFAVIPVGLIAAVTGIQVTMNVLAEFIGGIMVSGNAIALNYFKMYGYVTTAHAIYFANDLKLAHYAKIPPKHTFMAQMAATFVSTLICTSVFNFQMGFANVCTSAAAFGFTCPGQNTFFTAAVFWGTLSPLRLFGPGRRYNVLLYGFPLGAALPIVLKLLQHYFPRQKWLRQVHPVMICAGGLLWSPYNFGNFWPVVPITWLSWIYVKKRYIAFWSKYNYVLAAAWMAGIAVSAIVIFFALEIPGVKLTWWGNTVSYVGCEGTACRRLKVPSIGYFGDAPGTGNFT